MKTKVIVALLALLLCFRIGAQPNCSCPGVPASTTVTVAVVSSLSTQDADLCSDCGHTKSCCNLHADINASALISGAFGFVDFVQVVARFSEPTLFAVTRRHQSYVNKAPPATNKPTLLAMHQQLLI